MIRNFLPNFVRSPLWGDRRKYGLTIQKKDACWSEWQQLYLDFYHANQRQGVGTKVNDAGYEIMTELDMKDKTILEIGPGDIRHVRFWQSRPSRVILADVQQAMLDKASKILKDQKVATKTLLMQRKKPLPLEDNSVDVIVTFYSLEHIYPLSPYLSELKRVLKSDGFLAGAIPAEGGLAWGGGAIYYIQAMVQKKHPHQSGQDYLLGTSQFCRSHPFRTGSILYPAADSLLASAMAPFSGS